MVVKVRFASYNIIMDYKILFVIITSFIVGIVGLAIVVFKIRKDIIKKDGLEQRAHVTR